MILVTLGCIPSDEVSCNIFMSLIPYWVSQQNASIFFLIQSISGKIKEMLHKLSFKISSKPIKNPYVKDTGKKYCKMLPYELTEGKLIIHILHILL